jgi:hypothetical protein
MKMRVALAAAFLFFLGSTLSFAGDMPNLVGEWKSSGKGAVIVGKLTHKDPIKSPQFSPAHPFVLRIIKQDGHRFYGERFLSKSKSKEEVLGVIDEDGKSVYMVDDDGVFICTYDKAKDSLKAVYLEPGKDSKVTAIAVYTRVKK